jgi:serine/threonine protein kinase
MAVRVESQAEPIPGYRLMERLGGGGFGEVWKAEAPGGILKAIKFVYGNLQTASADGPRAEQELKALNRIKSVRHPYILSLERYDIIDGQLLIVMELADKNLWDRFKDCRDQGLPGIPRDELLRYMEDTAEALDLMNIEYQLQHLDIKPQNLFLVHNHAKVADFGLVKDLEGMMASVTGGVTPVYAAPETFDGWISRFCDQYSLAIVYQEILTGQRPFAGTNVRQLIMQHLQGTPNLDALPEGDRAPIARALAKNPNERFSSCRELVQALRGSKADAPSVSVSGIATSPEASTPAYVAPVVSPATPRPGSSRIVSFEDQEGTHPSPPKPASETQWIRIHDPAEPTPQDSIAATILRRQVEDDGALLPAVAIGIGELGLEALKSLRESIDIRFGAVDKLPNLRLLYLDTDPDAAKLIHDENPSRSLAPNDVLIVKLNRPSYYLRSQSRDRLHSWLNFKLLYRIPRNLLTTGVRALGRLAFVDNYRSISRRLLAELEACADVDELVSAGRKTGLGVRTSRPRVYVLAGLAGGTGSGMFLDTAYVARHLLRQMGYAQPEIIGVFLLPPADRHPSKAMGLANAFAALTELNHFSAPGTRFTVRYEDTEDAINDGEPPYSRCVFLSLPENTGSDLARRATDLAAEFVARDVTSTLGRTADEYRVFVSTKGAPVAGPACQTFGLYRISCPRVALLRSIGRTLCRQVVERWMTKDAKALRETIKANVAAWLKEQDLDGEHLISLLQNHCEQQLTQHPEARIASLIEPLAAWASRPRDLTAELPKEVSSRLEELVGRPATGSERASGQLHDFLVSASETIVSEWGKRLAEYAVGLIEQPQYRLAGAEETIRQLVAALDELIKVYEPLHNDLAGRAAEAYSRLGTLIASLAPLAGSPAKRLAAVSNSIVELMRAYPKWQYQAMVLHQVTSALVSVRGYLSEQLREMNFCRSRLTDLMQVLAEQLVAPAESSQSLGRSLYPSGCHTFEEAIEELLKRIDAVQVQEFDGRVQEVIRLQFGGLMHVCLTPANMIKELQEVMEREAESFIENLISSMSVAETYIASHGSVEETLQDLAVIYRDAAPALEPAAGHSHSEICLVATPPGPAGKQFNELLQQAVPGAEIEPVSNCDEILIYREVPNLTLAELEQLGPLGYEAYRQMSTVENFTPHSRSDIVEWRAAARLQKA